MRNIIGAAIFLFGFSYLLLICVKYTQGSSGLPLGYGLALFVMLMGAYIAIH